ncbi:MAG: hypothetical protein V4686_03700 [Patescibacteria group bacterium]
MKNFTFLLVLVLAVFVSQNTHAGYNSRSTADIQKFFNVTVPTSSQNVAYDRLKETHTALTNHATQVLNQMNAMTSLSTEPKVVLAQAPSLVTVTNNGVSTALMASFRLSITGGKGDTYIYLANGTLKSQQFSTTTSVSLIATDSNLQVAIQHPTYGFITVYRIPEGAVKMFDATYVFKASSLPAGAFVYTADLNTIRYFAGTPTGAIKTISLPLIQTPPTTFSNDSPVDTLPPVITYVSSVASSGVMYISWKTDEVSSSKVYYGTTTGSYFATQTGPSGTSHYAYLSAGVYPDATYYYTVESVDAAGNKSRSKEYTFVLKRPVGIGSFFKNYINNVKAQVVYMFGK